MNIATAQKRIDAIQAAMVAKGMRKPDARLNIEANKQPGVVLTWETGLRRDDIYPSNTKYHFARADTAAEALDKADAFVAEQDDAEQTKLKDFLGALGSVIDLGREHGIEADYLNPLEASMKKLSKNILTDQRAA